ncbi:MAG: hypothetical protein ACO29V_12700 [Limnohabitans sp.]|jgi:hypothetical protein
MSKDPLVPLRWYELMLLRFLLRSPRIARIIVQQPVPENDPPYEGANLDYVSQLEALYHGPSAGDYREG